MRCGQEPQALSLNLDLTPQPFSSWICQRTIADSKPQARGCAESIARGWKVDVRTSVDNPIAMNGNQFFDIYLARGTALPRPSEREAGPSTSASDNQSASPPYYLGQIRSPVGGMVPREPFAIIPQLKAHLGLLRGFRELKNRVTNFAKGRKIDRHRARLIKASVYANKNLRYHLDKRYKLTEDGYSKATDTVTWEARSRNSLGTGPTC